jgi:RHS repeat-associated protein
MFTGEQTDANGLVYLRARYYHPELGVFTALDPVEGSMQQPMSLNRYGYVAGNVVNRVDPSGESMKLIETQNECLPKEVQSCPISGNRPVLGRCWFPYSKDRALNWALDPTQTTPVRQQYSTTIGAGTFCSTFMFYVITEGGMPILYDASSESGFNTELGLCSPLEEKSLVCRENARDADDFVLKYLKRGCTNARCEPVTGTPEAFWPPVQVIPNVNILPGDLIYQSMWDIGTPHVAMFVGWGPDLTPGLDETKWEDLEDWYEEVGDNFRSYITDQQQAPEQVWWVIDDIDRALRDRANPYVRPFVMYGRASDISQILRILPVISVDLEYLRASTRHDT